MRASERARRTSSAVPLYVIILVAFQVFLVTVAVEAFQTDAESLAWATAAGLGCPFRRRRGVPALPAAMTAASTPQPDAAAPEPDRDAVPRILRARDGHRHHRHRRSQQQTLDWLAESLYVVAAIAYAVLAVLVVVRLVAYPRRLVADLTSHAKGFGFLTIVAGTNVLASASALIHGWWTLAEVLWWCSLPLYVVLVYTALIADVLRHDNPPSAPASTASWFLLTVVHRIDRRISAPCCSATTPATSSPSSASPRSASDSCST